MLRKIFRFFFSFAIFTLKLIFFTFLITVFFVTYFILGIVNQARKEIDDVSKVKRKIPVQSTEFYSLDNKRVGKVYVENRYWVSIRDIPESVKICLIASEDERFYYHRGVDFLAVLRSMIDILVRREITQGGSTITQQLARILFLTPDVTLKRKIKEAVLAVELEKVFSKQEIMEMYLNLVYFGEGAYGIEAASRVYFAKSVKELNIPEAAMIIGILPAPSVYSPYVNFKAAKTRQVYVLRKLLELKYISHSEYQKYKNYPIKLKREKLEEDNILYPYYTNYVIQNFRKITGIDYESLQTLGLKVYMNMDSRIQDEIQRILQEQIDKHRSNWNVNQGAIILIENYTGRVLAMVGGYRYSISDQFNRAYQAFRQPGSVFKIVVYTAALSAGFQPYSSVEDKVYTYTGSDGKPYSPVNWDRKYWGRMSLIDSFAFSRNTVAVYLANSVGIDKVIETAYRMGIKTKLEPYLSTALGSSVLTPLEVATFTSVIANSGYLVEPVFVSRVEDRYGGTIYFSRNKYLKVLPYQVAQDMRLLMKAVVDRGTGYSARIQNIDCYGKTGTTSDHRDAWFAGFTDDFTCIVWLGNDDYSQLYNVYGATLPAQIWKKCILTAYKYYRPKNNPKKQRDSNTKEINLKTKEIKKESTKQVTTFLETDNTTIFTTTEKKTTETTTTVDYNTFPWENTD
ncbi:MAG: PBP1A family penicillin-binding protein [bacterium]|nr:PBP1A family penicillin-binding protein [bacterium]